MEWGINLSSFLVRIPKEFNPSNFSKFCRISLCNASYKILTKIIICKRTGCYSPTPNFERERGVCQTKKKINNIILVQEAIYLTHINRDKGMVIKFYLSSAFDRAMHSFLFEVLKNLDSTIVSLDGCKLA
jgi:hypothetical protein